MMGSSIPFRSHWPKVLVDSSGNILNAPHDMGGSISRKPAYRGKTPLHPPGHYCFKEKYFPHGSQAFQSLLAQYQARAMIQPGLECVGVHIPTPMERQALNQAQQGSSAADQPRSDTQGGQGTAAGQGPDSTEPGPMESQAPEFQQKCPCELVTQKCCPCKQRMERELAKMAETCPQDEQQQQVESVVPSPVEPLETLEASSTQLEAETSPEPLETLAGSPTTPLENLETSPELPENLELSPTEPSEKPETSPEPPESLEPSPTVQLETSEVFPEPGENPETSPEAPENVETSPEPPENVEPVENLETSPEAPENLEGSPTEQVEDLTSSPDSPVN
ncbi:hypothetical protein chiPu_0018792 [Chiloscyllium punctatum]|uniref:Uncharacterized protein n=1 Tax=Chiloscyllium punctatum TaxID=137246 RepID=A0A401RPY7_CHIPU|nr:hypothetical protein [Chiloscyllium punctatum]